MMRMSSSAEELLSKHSLKKYEWKHRKIKKRSKLMIQPKNGNPSHKMKNMRAAKALMLLGIPRAF